MTDELVADLAEVDTLDEVPERFVIGTGDEPTPGRTDAGTQGLMAPDDPANANPDGVEFARETQAPSGPRAHETSAAALALVSNESAGFLVPKPSQCPAPKRTRRAPPPRRASVVPNR